MLSLHQLHRAERRDISPYTHDIIVEYGLTWKLNLHEQHAALQLVIEILD